MPLPLRSSGYASRIYEWGYGIESPLYDLIVRWGMFPLGGERACRRRFARWCSPEPDMRLLSLCCGTGNTDRALLELEPALEIVGIDLGSGQLATARRKNPGSIDYRQGDASATGLDSDSFDRVSIVLALHEMPRALRLRVPARGAAPVQAGGPGDRDRARAAGAACTAFPAGALLALLDSGKPGGAHIARAATERSRPREMTEAGLVVLERHATSPDWIQCVVAAPPR